MRWPSSFDISATILYLSGMKMIELGKIRDTDILDMAQSFGLAVTGSGGGMNRRDWSIQNVISNSIRFRPGQGGRIMKAGPIPPEKIAAVRKYCRQHGIDVQYMENDSYSLNLSVPMSRW